MKKKELSRLLEMERRMYCYYMFPSRRRRFMAWLKAEPVYLIMNWQRVSRLADYYKKSMDEFGGIINSVKYLWYVSKRNRMALKLGIEIDTRNIASGLLVYHYSGGIVINGGSIIGKNCHLHGNNCIGNAGSHDLRCPVIGDNVMLGVGAKVIGSVKIGNNVRVAANAVVVKDVPSNCVVAGVPAVVVKHLKDQE